MQLVIDSLKTGINTNNKEDETSLRIKRFNINNFDRINTFTHEM